MPTKLDVIALAHRLIGVLSADEVPSAEQNSYASGVLDGIFAELTTAQGLTITWTLDTTPSYALIGLAETLASDLAPHYGLSFKRRSSGMMRLRAALLQDDREDDRDLDDDGTVTTDESDAAAYGIYF